MKSSITHMLVACIAFFSGLGVTHLSGVPSDLSPEPVEPAAGPPPVQSESTSKRTSRNQVDYAETEAPDVLHGKVTQLEQLVARLRDHNTQLEQRSAALSDQMQAFRDTIDNEVESHGLTYDYVKDLGAAGLSQNLIVTAEGQVGHQLTNREVRELNARLRELAAEFMELEQLNANVEDGESGEDFVLRIPPLESADGFEMDVEQLFVDTLGLELGGEFFRENRDVLAHALSNFGRDERLIIIRPDGSGFRSREMQISPNGESTVLTSPTLQSDELLQGLRHLVEISD